MFNKKYMQYKKTLGRDTIYLFLVYRKNLIRPLYSK